jgi:hypothetical protein
MRVRMEGVGIGKHQHDICLSKFLVLDNFVVNESGEKSKL